jgi:hypothetical protein
MSKINIIFPALFSAEKSRKNNKIRRKYHGKDLDGR